MVIRKLYKICEAYEVGFPGNADPFRILARLMEESGELAEQVHLREGLGLKRQKHGEPDDKKLAKEIQDIMTAVLDIARYYGIEDVLETQVDIIAERATPGQRNETRHGVEILALNDRLAKHDAWACASLDGSLVGIRDDDPRHRPRADVGGHPLAEFCGGRPRQVLDDQVRAQLAQPVEGDGRVGDVNDADVGAAKERRLETRPSLGVGHDQHGVSRISQHVLRENRFATADRQKRPARLACR